MAKKDVKIDAPYSLTIGDITHEGRLNVTLKAEIEDALSLAHAVIFAAVLFFILVLVKDWPSV